MLKYFKLTFDYYKNKNELLLINIKNGCVFYALSYGKK